MKRITLITGHYGSGKTNFAVNLALRQAAEGKKVTVVDLDIVNPYFRTADFAELFEQNGIHLEKTLYANTSLDIPAISFDLARLAYEEECLIIDVGGDDAGATALGRYAEMLRSYQAELDMWYVVNRYRYLTAQPQEALTLLYEVQQAARLQPTGIVNNSNLGSETTAETVPNLVGLRYTTDIKGNSAYDDYRIVMVEQSSDTVAQGVVISQDPPAGSEKLMDDQIIQITVSSGPSLVEMPDIIGFTQANASKKLDALGIQYKMVMVDNDGTMAAGCVASTDYKAGTKINTENVTVIVSIAGERDDTLVAQTGNAGESTPEPTPQPEE